MARRQALLKYNRSLEVSDDGQHLSAEFGFVVESFFPYLVINMTSPFEGNKLFLVSYENNILTFIYLHGVSRGTGKILTTHI